MMVKGRFQLMQEIKKSVTCMLTKVAVTRVVLWHLHYLCACIYHLTHTHLFITVMSHRYIFTMDLLHQGNIWHFCSKSSLRFKLLSNDESADIHVTACSAHFIVCGLPWLIYISETTFLWKIAMKIMSHHYLIEVQFELLLKIEFR